VEKGDLLNVKFPDGWEEKFSTFGKLLLTKVFRPEKILFTVQEFVLQMMGQYYVENPPMEMDLIYKESDKKTPIIFVLSQGADPRESMLKFAKKKDMESERLRLISLG